MDITMKTISREFEIKILEEECCSLRTADVSPCSSQLRDVSRNVPRRR